MNDENDVRVVQIIFDFRPLAIAQRRSEVICSYTQIEIVRTVDLSLRMLERREQTRPDVEDHDLHEILTTDYTD